VLLIVHEDTNNGTSKVFTLVRISVKGFWCKNWLNSSQTWKDTEDDDSRCWQFTCKTLGIAGCMIHFKHRLPTKDAVNSPKQYCLTQGDTLWYPSSFSEQLSDKFYQQVIDKRTKEQFEYQF
jgi:hypothetical protein